MKIQESSEGDTPPRISLFEDIMGLLKLVLVLGVFLGVPVLLVLALLSPLLYWLWKVLSGDGFDYLSRSYGGGTYLTTCIIAGLLLLVVIGYGVSVYLKDRHRLRTISPSRKKTSPTSRRKKKRR